MANTRAARRGGEDRRGPGDVAGGERRFRPARRRLGRLPAARDREDVTRVRELRVLVRVQVLAEALEPPGEAAEPGRFGRRDVTAARRARGAQHVQHGVDGDQRPPRGQPGGVEHGPVFPHRHGRELDVTAAVGQLGEQPQVGLAQRRGRLGERPVQRVGLLLEGPAQPQEGDAVLDGRDQLVVSGQQFGVGVLVAAVPRQVEQPGQAVVEEREQFLVGLPAAVHGDEGRAQAAHPELDGQVRRRTRRRRSRGAATCA
ncbi:hypothetical protein OHS18_41285 [Amycolatopsis sp. NBC_00355]|uniref:hypothetical protein n=1 Tax=Amycolatopsis sp. NBC_00355 TaxID=2975957 RepID=UPI002E2528B3